MAGTNRRARGVDDEVGLDNVRAFLPLPPSAPFAVQEGGLVYLRFAAGPHLPTPAYELTEWKQYLAGRASDSDALAMLNSIERAEQEAADWTHNENQ